MADIRIFGDVGFGDAEVNERDHAVHIDGFAGSTERW